MKDRHNHFKYMAKFFSFGITSVCQFLYKYLFQHPKIKLINLTETTSLDLSSNNGNITLMGLGATGFALPSASGNILIGASAQYVFDFEYPNLFGKNPPANPEEKE